MNKYQSLFWERNTKTVWSNPSALVTLTTFSALTLPQSRKLVHQVIYYFENKGRAELVDKTKRKILSTILVQNQLLLLQPDLLVLYRTASSRPGQTLTFQDLCLQSQAKREENYQINYILITFIEYLCSRANSTLYLFMFKEYLDDSGG